VGRRRDRGRDGRRPPIAWDGLLIARTQFAFTIGYLGINWSVFAERASNVIGPFFAYEVLMAFFLEAGFIGIMLFGAGPHSWGSGPP